MVFHRSLSDIKSPQVSYILGLSILADLNNAIVRLIMMLRISNLFSLFSGPLIPLKRTNSSWSHCHYYYYYCHYFYYYYCCCCIHFSHETMNKNLYIGTSQGKFVKTLNVKLGPTTPKTITHFVWCFSNIPWGRIWFITILKWRPTHESKLMSICPKKCLRGKALDDSCWILLLHI